MKRTRLKPLIAAAVTLLLMAPTGAALASSNESGLAARAESRRVHRQLTHPTVTIDRVYRGDIEGAMATYTWTGDVFGTGTDTLVTYTVGVDDGGVPVVTSVVVDESTLPEGATYTVRDGSVTTRSADDEAPEEPEEKSDDADDETTDDTSSDDEASNVEVSATTSTTAADDSTGDAAEDDSSDDPADDESTVTRYSGRAGVHFQMDERWAGLMILVHGAFLGDGESVAYLRTILVSPPANGRDDGVDEEQTDEESTDPDRHKDPAREVSNDEHEKDRGDKERRDRDQDRDGRGDDDRRDGGGTDDGRGSRGGHDRGDG